MIRLVTLEGGNGQTNPLRELLLRVPQAFPEAPDRFRSAGISGECFVVDSFEYRSQIATIGFPGDLRKF